MKRLITLLLILCKIGYAQTTFDSLKTVSENKKADPYKRASAYYELSNIVDENLIKVNCDKAFEHLTQVDSSKVESEGFYNLKGNIYANYGYYYRAKGLIRKAMEAYSSAQRYSEKIRDKRLLANMQNNFGMLYYSQNQFKDAILYYKKSIETYQTLNDPQHLASTYMNLAGAYQNDGSFDMAILNFKKALTMFVQQKDTFYTGFAYNNLAVCFKKFDLNDSAFFYLNKSLPLFEKLKAQDEIAWTYDILGGIYTALGKYEVAETYCLKCVEMAQKRNLPSQLRSCLNNLYMINKHNGNYKSALRYYIQSDSLQDSLINNNNRLMLARSQVEYEFNKKEEVLNIEAQKKTLQFSEESKRNRIIIFSVIAILGVSLFFGYMVFKSLNLEKLAKKTVVMQKEIIEEKQREMIDSITYARHLQEAILPPTALWKSQLPNSFIIYKPKDIVAGDFYWMEKTNGLLLFAVADCTGHGVPGAMVSVVCSNALNRSVLEFKLTDPGEILDKTRELVISTFEKSEKQVRDGMDISLCIFNQHTQVLKWSGANNPLWYIHHRILTRIAPNKQPIGEYVDETPFTTHTVQLYKGDSIYLFTDGYADQFGGEKGKKFKYKQLEELIVSIAELSPEQQSGILNQRFNSWKGDLSQVDDVTIIGVTI